MEKGNAGATVVQATGAGGRAVDVVVGVGSEAAATMKGKVLDKVTDAAVEETRQRLHKDEPDKDEPDPPSGSDASA